MAMGLIQLVEAAFDGTRVKANASRLRTWTAAKVEGVLQELETQVEQMLKEADTADAADATLWGEGPSRALPPELADGAFGTGRNLEGMETRGVDFYTPVESPAPQEGNPAQREDPRRPVAEKDWPNLPRNDKKKLAKSCFLYDEAADCYYCPMGNAMEYKETKKYARSLGTVELRVFRCCECEGCPLAPECLDPKAKRGRTVTRDGYEPLREKMHAKMQTVEGTKTYNRRMHIGETPFAIIKGIMGVRRFLLRGLEKVRAEWRWVCTAYNLKKLIAALAALRAQGETMPVGVGG